MCACEAILRGAIDFKVDAQGGGLGEDVADLLFQLGVKQQRGESERTTNKAKTTQFASK